jgi:hypothetical protein
MKFFFQVRQSQFGRSLGEGGTGDRAEVSVGAVEVTELRVRFSGKFRDGSPQEGAANSESCFFVCGKGAA